MGHHILLLLGVLALLANCNCSQDIRFNSEAGSNADTTHTANTLKQIPNAANSNIDATQALRSLKSLSDVQQHVRSLSQLEATSVDATNTEIDGDHKALADVVARRINSGNRNLGTATTTADTDNVDDDEMDDDNPEATKVAELAHINVITEDDENEQNSAGMDAFPGRHRKNRNQRLNNNINQQTQQQQQQLQNKDEESELDDIITTVGINSLAAKNTNINNNQGTTSTNNDYAVDVEGEDDDEDYIEGSSGEQQIVHEPENDDDEDDEEEEEDDYDEDELHPGVQRDAEADYDDVEYDDDDEYDNNDEIKSSDYELSDIVDGVGGKEEKKKEEVKYAAFEKDPLPLRRNISAWQARRGPNQPHQLGSSTFMAKDHPEVGYVAACVVARDAHGDILEWVHYHLRLGIWPIYVYDHGSIPPMSGVLANRMQSGSVVYHYFTQFVHSTNRPQLYGYDKCLKDHGHKHHWMVFFDIDEFLMFRKPPRIQSLPALLQFYEDYSALAVHWILFGSSNYNTRQARGVLRSYYKCLPLQHDQHLFIKTIANTKCTVSTSDSPHTFIHNCTAPVVRTNFAPVQGQKATNTVHNILALHHYTTKSAEEFMIKMARGSGMKRQRGWEYFWFVDKWSVEFNFDAMAVWDDDVLYQALLGPQALALQLEQYEQEQHEENFWGKVTDQLQGKKGVGVVQKQQRKLNTGDTDSIVDSKELERYFL